MFVDFNILNQLGSPSINSNTFANRPAAGQTGRLFVSTDTFELYRDNGTGWDLIGGPGSSTVTGSGATGQVTYWTGASTIGGNNNLFWDTANSRLGIGTTTPGHKLQINGTGTLLSLNGGSDTYMLFAGNGSDQYQIGYTDNAADYRRFSIYDSTGAKEVLTIDKQSRYVGINYQYSSLADQPAYTLDVSGSTRATDSSFFVTSGTGQVGINTTIPTATALVQANKTDGYGLYLNYTTSTGSGSTATALWALNNTSGSGFAAVIEEKTANTTGGQYPLLIKHSLSSGTAGVGMGTGIHWQLPDDAGTFKTTQLTVETTDPVAANYSTRYRFNVQSNGSSTAVAYINNVGLGVKTVPSTYNLDVNGSANATTLYENGVRVVTSSGISGTTNYVAKFTGTNTVGNSVIQDNGTAVGIGITPNSAYKLYVSGKIWGTGVGNAATLTLEDTQVGGATVELNPQYGTGLPILRAGTGFPLLLGANYTENARFSTAGAFLLNTTTDISAVGKFVTYFDSSNSWAYVVNNTYTATTNNGYLLRYYNNGTEIASIYAENNSSALFNYVGKNGIAFLTGSVPLGTERARFTSGGNFLIGTTTDNGNKLQVTGSANVTGNIGIGNATPTTSVTINGSTGTTLGIQITPSGWNNAAHRFVVPTSGDTSILSYNYNGSTVDTSSYGTSSISLTQGALLFATGNVNVAPSEKMRINVNGQVGIGTNNPLWNLHINGAANATTGIAIGNNNSTRLLLYHNDAAGTNYITTNGAQSPQTLVIGSADTLNFTSGGTSERARFSTGGNFLIGTTTDNGSRLQVSGTATFSSDTTVSGIASLGIGATTNIAYIGDRTTVNTRYIKFNRASSLTDIVNIQGVNGGVGNADIALQAEGGSVGIGTLTPSEKLEVNGAIKTAAPITGTAAAWKLGSRVAATVVLSTTQYIEVDIGGTLYKLAVVT